MVTSKRELIREIKRLKRSGEPLNFRAVHKSHYTLVAHATDQFGSWQAAIEAAGLDYGKISKLHRWSKAEILQQLRELHRRGEIRNVKSLSLDHPKLFAACRRAFGTGCLALEAAGIDYQQLLAKQPNRWTKAKILAHLQERNAAGKSLSRAVIMREEPEKQRFCNAALHRFGTWGAALKAAGINPQAAYNRDRLWTKERVLEEIRARYASGQLLYTDFMMRDALPLHAAGKRHFGSWQKAVERAGINYHRHVRGGLHGFSRERTKRALHARLANNQCSQTLVRDESPLLFQAALHHFDNWESALRVARGQS